LAGLVFLANAWSDKRIISIRKKTERIFIAVFYVNGICVPKKLPLTPTTGRIFLISAPIASSRLFNQILLCSTKVSKKLDFSWLLFLLRHRNLLQP
jgi:hypothetical protein